MNRFTLLTLSILLLSSCASVGNEARIKPSTDKNWKYVSENYLHDNMVQYDCSDFKINVSEVLIRSRTYFIGPLIPIIPIFYGIDYTKESPGLKMEVRITSNSESMTEYLPDITIIDERLTTHIGSVNPAFSTPYGFLYNVEFDIRRDSTSSFKMNFLKQIKNCTVPSLNFELNDFTGLRYWSPGP